MFFNASSKKGSYRLSTASVENGRMFSEGKEGKKQKMDGVEMGTGGEKEVHLSTSSKFHSQIMIRQSMQPRPVFEDLLNKFWCKVPRGSLHVSLTSDR